jgi:anti-anti-sigma factor
MAPIKSLSVSVSRRGRPVLPAGDSACVVVWLRGEHDLSTVADLSDALTQAVKFDDADVVVDLSEVRFIDVATVRVIRRAQDLLRARSRCLVLRSPPGCVSRVLELCGDADLLAPPAATPATGAADALGTWVPVPVTDQADQPADAFPPLPTSAPDPVSATLLGTALVSSVVADHRDDKLTTTVASPGAP